MSESQRERQPLLLSSQSHDRVAVWPIIHMIRGDVIHYIDTPLTFEALTAPDLTYTLVRPLEEKYNAIQQAGNKSVVFCFLLNRAYFIREQNIATGPLSCTRADLCELLAIRLLRHNGNCSLHLAIALTTCWPVWTGADPHIIQIAKDERDGDLEERVGNALEMAIISRARRFIKSSPCQKVIDDIWIGRCVYQAESSHSILSDRYKRTPIHFYDPHKAPLLDHYRLKVPAIRSVLDYANFLILFILFVIAIETNEPHRINTPESIFMICALGFTLEKLAAMQEHGIKGRQCLVFFILDLSHHVLSVYSKGTWNGFDLAFVTTYSVYAFFRIYGVVYHKQWARGLGNDFLALIACLLFPRLAFVTLQNNLMVLSLRAMMMQFVALMLIAAFCFCGFLYALWTLSRKGAGYSAGTIAWWMLDLWFGLDASGFDRAFEFDIVFGPILMITYACLSNTLLLTVLVSILSNTFARINEDAAAEAMFRRAVSVLEGVKADSLFSYQPPINIIALCILFPASYVLSGQVVPQDKRILDKGDELPNLTGDRMRKSSNSYGFYDTVSAAAETLYDRLPRPLKRLSLLRDWLALMQTSISSSRLWRNSEEGTSNIAQVRMVILPEVPCTLRILLENAQKDVVRHRRLPTKRRPPHGPNDHAQHVSTAAALRRRLNSMINRTDVLQSPLAQVFQPVVVDDEIPEEHAPDKEPLPQPHSGNGHMVSYGPASRRRLASMHLASKRTTDSAAQTSGTSRRPAFPAIDTRPEALVEGPHSASPDRQPETAEQVEETMANNGGLVELSQKIKDMEDRQKRIESILIQLSERLQS
ncbi:hypothetical protein EDC04DRAFT_3139831 [Pisolithus marmoratus]|nr:hypothetical protein EDC04DRAFT_3139831 [Pisolithus marmoratus]